MADDTPDWAKEPVEPDEQIPDWAKSSTAQQRYLPSTVSGAVSSFLEPITSYPATYSEMNKEAREQVGQGVDQLSKHESAWDVAKGAGNVALGSLGYVSSPISAGIRTIVGKPIEEATGIPKEYTEFATSLALPGIGFSRIPGAAAVPKMPPRGPLGVTLSEGQASGELSLIQREQAALRGQSGAPAQARAQEFATQQAEQLSGAKENITRGFDEFGNIIAETPQESAGAAAQRFRSAAASAKEDVTQAYKTAREMPGEIRPEAFDNIVPTVQRTLSELPNPVIVNELTPWANKAMDLLKDKVTNLKLTNKAESSTGVLPSGEEATLTGINLNGIDQWRKQLSTMRRNSFNPQDMSDYRATSAILDAFDSQINQAVNSGMFRGDPRAVQAWNDARAAFSDYKSTFGKQSNDPVGRVVQKVLGDRINEPASANAVADHLFGSSGINPSDLNRGVAQRFKNVIGENSSEWSGVKQGLFSRLTEAGADLAEWGPKKTADRINKFLNIDGKEMANVVYSPAERQAIQSYADLLRKIEVPQAGANWSNTGTAKVFQKIGGGVGTLIGTILGSGAGQAVGLPWGFGEAAGIALTKGSQKLANTIEARKIAKQMPILANQMEAWGKSYIKNQKTPTPASQRMLLGASITLDSTLRKFGTSLDQVSQETAGETEREAIQYNAEGIPQIRINRLPTRATGGSVFDKMHMARKRAEGGGTDVPFNEWDAVPRNAEGIPQIRIEKPPVNEADEAQAAREAAAARVAGNVRGAPYEPTPPSTEGKTWMMEPGKEAVQSGNYEMPQNVRLNDADIPYNVETGEELQMVRRPNVLPLTRTPDGVQWAMPRIAELAGDIVNPLAVTKGVALNPGEFALGSGPIKRSVLDQPNAPTFYSALDRAVADIPQTKAPAEQWAATLANRPGVKPEEIQWRGLDQYLAGRQGQTVTKQEIAAHLAGNKVELGTVQKGLSRDNLRPDDVAKLEYGQRWQERVAMQEEIRAARPHDWWESPEFQSNQRVMDDLHNGMVDDTLARLGGEQTPTKFSEYQLPGGENYSEKLLTLPGKTDTTKLPDGYRLEPSLLNGNKRVEVYGPGSGRYASGDTPEQAIASFHRQHPAAGSYKSSHWDEPNPVTHMRTNERTIGNTASHHIEEVQSDWHQKGRDAGYRGEPTDKAVEEKASSGFDQAWRGGGKSWETAAEDERKIWRENTRARMIEKGDGVPDAPFKKTWPDLTMKQALRDAVEGGFDRLSWTPGEAQALRYPDELRKSVSSIEWHNMKSGKPNPTGEKQILVEHKQGGGQTEFTVNKDGVVTAGPGQAVGKPINEVIGKDMSRQIMEQPTGSIDGKDFVMGAHGMTEFYDKMLPKAVEKLGKAYGVKVQRGVDTTGNPVNYVDIPPAWKQEILKKGFSLFAAGGSVFDKMQEAKHMQEGGGLSSFLEGEYSGNKQGQHGWGYLGIESPTWSAGIGGQGWRANTPEGPLGRASITNVDVGHKKGDLNLKGSYSANQREIAGPSSGGNPYFDPIDYPGQKFSMPNDIDKRFMLRLSKPFSDGGSVFDKMQNGGVPLPTPSPRMENYNAANVEMDLTPEEQALYQRHLLNLYGTGGVDNQNGTRSTLYQSVEQGPDGKYYNVPTVWDGKIETENWTRPADGKVFDVPNAVAKQNIGNAGWASFPSYATPDEADTRYDQMHRYMEKDTNQYQKKKGGSVFDKMKRASK